MLWLSLVCLSTGIFWRLSDGSFWLQVTAKTDEKWHRKYIFPILIIVTHIPRPCLQLLEGLTGVFGRQDDYFVAKEDNVVMVLHRNWIINILSWCPGKVSPSRQYPCTFLYYRKSLFVVQTKLWQFVSFPVIYIK